MPLAHILAMLTPQQLEITAAMAQHKVYACEAVGHPSPSSFHTNDNDDDDDENEYHHLQQLLKKGDDAALLLESPTADRHRRLLMMALECNWTHHHQYHYSTTC